MTVNDRVAAHRRRMKDRGFRPVQIWVPDVRDPSLIDEARRQSAMIGQADSEQDDQAFVEAISVGWGEE